MPAAALMAHAPEVAVSAQKETNVKKVYPRYLRNT